MTRLARLVWLAAVLAALLALAIGCGGAPAPTATAHAEPEPPVEPPLVWEPGTDLVRVRGLGVAFRVHAPLSRFAPDELGTPTCGEHMLHAIVIDRRTFQPSDAVLAHAFWRAGCEAPDEGEILDIVEMSEGSSARVRFDDTDMRGEWSIRSVILERAHRVVVIVSAIRVEPGTDAAPLFEVVSDAPGLAGLADPISTEELRDERLRETMGLVFGVVDAVAPTFDAARSGFRSDGAWQSFGGPSPGPIPGR